MKKNELNYLYHIRRDVDDGDTSCGYVGISNNPERRFKVHKRGRTNPILSTALSEYDDVNMMILESGTRKEMLTKEAELRPFRSMGWNIAKGGCIPPSWDELSDPDLTKKKISDSLKGKKVSMATREKLSKASTGKTHSKETRDKLSKIGKRNVGKLNNNFRGWWIIYGIEYESLSIASDCTGIKDCTIRQRAYSENFPDYKFLPKDTIK